MKVVNGFFQRLAAEADRIRSGGKDALRRFKMPTMAFPVSEGMSDAPTSTDLAAPGRLAAAKKDEKKGGISKMLMFPALPGPLLAKPMIKEHRDPVKEQKTPDATMPLDEKSVGTITYDTSKGTTMVN